MESAKDKSIKPPREQDGATGAKVHRKDKDVGDALRAVYREAIDETVPDEMLSLLKKLG